MPVIVYLPLSSGEFLTRFFRPSLSNVTMPELSGTSTSLSLSLTLILTSPETLASCSPQPTAASRNVTSRRERPTRRGNALIRQAPWEKNMEGVRFPENPHALHVIHGLCRQRG